MMQLYLVRHGIAINREDPDSPPEAERFLTEKGIQKTRAAAEGLKALELEPAALLTSPYLRAVQTAEIFCEVLGLRSLKLRRTDALLPEAAPADLFRELRRLHAREVMCFGHAPNLDLLIAHAAGAPRQITELKKAGVACLALPGHAPGQGSLVWIATPKMLRSAAG